MKLHDIDTLLQVFEDYVIDHPNQGSPDTLYEPIRYIQTLGGKRIRPVLLLMAYNLWKENVAPALPAAMAVECFHNFTLMHDDIMDEAKLRRGKECVHIKYGRNAAILSGDAMLIISFQLLTDLDIKHKPAISLAGELAKVALEICEGQQMDMDFETGDCPSESEYIEMIRKKTACLLGSSLRMGAILAGASTSDADKLYFFGENLGTAFQIRDDLLDTFGDVHLTGKQPGGDIRRGKKNFLYVKTFNSLSEQLKVDFIKQYAEASETDAVEPIIQKFRSLNIESDASVLEASYFKKSLMILEELDNLNTSPLRSLATSLLHRDR